MTMITENKNVQKNDVLSAFTLFFPGYNAQFLPRSIFFSNPTSKHSFTLDDRTFDVVQETIIEITGTRNNIGG
jgi:hypothetical protein